MQSMARPATDIMACGHISPGPGVGTRRMVEGGLGRSVTVDKVRLMLRADFPHDGTEERRRGVLRWKPRNHSASSTPIFRSFLFPLDEPPGCV